MTTSSCWRIAAALALLVTLGFGPLPRSAILLADDRIEVDEAVLERVMDAYRRHGERFVEAILLADVSRELVRRQIPGIDNWVGFESWFWRQMTEEQRQRVFTSLALALDEAEPEAPVVWWRQWHEWMDAVAQLRLLGGALGAGVEDAMQAFYEDELLQPAFNDARVNRGPEFPDHLMGVTLASGERVLITNNMARLLVEATPTERFACYSRLYALAATLQAPAPNETPAPDEPDEPAK